MWPDGVVRRNVGVVIADDGVAALVAAWLTGPDGSAQDDPPPLSPEEFAALWRSLDASLS